MKVKDEIIYWPPPTGAFVFGQSENVDEVIHEGIEVTIESTILQGSRSSGSYTFVDTDIREAPYMVRNFRLHLSIWEVSVLSLTLVMDFQSGIRQGLSEKDILQATYQIQWIRCPGLVSGI